MAKGWPRLTAKDFRQMYGRQLIAADAKNGTHDAPDGTRQVGLTADDLLALVEWYVAAHKANGMAWSEWYPLTLVALGYKKKGDKFPSLAVWNAKAKGYAVPAADLAMVWTAMEEAAADLDEIDAAIRKGPKDFVVNKNVGARWRRATRAAWERMKRERKIPPMPIVPNPFAGMGTLLIVLAVLWLASKD